MKLLLSLMFPTQFDSWKEVIKKVLLQLYLLYHKSRLLCYHSLDALQVLHHYLYNAKLIAIFNWIFHVSDLLRSFMTSFFKYGLVLLRYSSTDSVLFLSPLLLYSI